MLKKIKEQRFTIICSAVFMAVMFLALRNMPTEVTAANSTSGDRYENPNEVEIDIPEPDPYEESKKIAEEQVQQIEEEGAKVEHQTVDGIKSEAKGLYLANKVKGVAVDPSTSNEGGSALYVQTADTDTVKSSGAMASINNVAERYRSSYYDTETGLHQADFQIGPVVDVYFKKTENGKVVPGTAKDVDNIKIGIPDSFKQEGYRYGYVLVFPGGKTISGMQWDKDANSNYVTVNLVHDTYNDPVDYSQATIALVKYDTYVKTDHGVYTQGGGNETVTKPGN